MKTDGLYDYAPPSKQTTTVRGKKKYLCKKRLAETIPMIVFGLVIWKMSGTARISALQLTKVTLKC